MFLGLVLGFLLALIRVLGIYGRMLDSFLLACNFL